MLLLWCAYLFLPFDIISNFVSIVRHLYLPLATQTCLWLLFELLGYLGEVIRVRCWKYCLIHRLRRHSVWWCLYLEAVVFLVLMKRFPSQFCSSSSWYSIPCDIVSILDNVIDTMHINCCSKQFEVSRKYCFRRRAETSANPPRGQLLIQFRKVKLATMLGDANSSRKVINRSRLYKYKDIPDIPSGCVSPSRQRMLYFVQSAEFNFVYVYRIS